MPRNSSGTYSLPAGNPVVSNTLIQTTWANPTMSDIGSSITDSLDRNGRGAMLAPLKGIDGTMTAPGYSFSSEGTLGMYRVSAGVLGFAAGAALVFSISAAGPAFVLPVTFALGTAAAPSITFTGNTNTGIYSPGTSQVSITTAGVDRLAVSAVGVVTLSDGALVLGSTSANFITSLSAAATLNFQTGGASTRLSIDSAGNIAVSGPITTSANVTLLNGVSIGWRDTGGTARAGAVLSSSGYVFGDVANAIAGSTTAVRANTSVELDVNNVALATLKSTGLAIGQGNTTATQTLDVLGAFSVRDSRTASAASSSRIFGGAFTGNQLDMLIGVAASGSNQITLGGGSSVGEPATLLTFNTGTAGAVGAGTERMRIDVSGNVGIGGTPGSLITGYGTRLLVENTAAAPALVVFHGDGTNNQRFGMFADSVNNLVGFDTQWTTTSNGMIFKLGGTERMRLDTAGNLGIGVTAVSRLDVSTGTTNRFRVGESVGSLFIDSLTTAGTAWGPVIERATIQSWYVAATGTPAGGMVLDSSGNFFVGNPTAVSPAAGRGLIEVNGSTAAFVGLNVAGAQKAFLFYDGTNTTLNTNTGAINLTQSGTTRFQITSGGLIADAAGLELGWKDIPQNNQTAAYTLVIGDRGRNVAITTGGVTVPASVFSAANVVTVTNNSATAQTITQGASVTLHQAGTTSTGNRTLAPWGICSVLCIAANTFIISGNIS